MSKPVSFGKFLKLSEERGLDDVPDIFQPPITPRPIRPIPMKPLPPIPYRPDFDDDEPEGPVDVNPEGPDFDGDGEVSSEEAMRYLAMKSRELAEKLREFGLKQKYIEMLLRVLNGGTLTPKEIEELRKALKKWYDPSQRDAIRLLFKYLPPSVVKEILRRFPDLSPLLPDDFPPDMIP